MHGRAAGPDPVAALGRPGARVRRRRRAGPRPPGRRGGVRALLARPRVAGAPGLRARAGDRPRHRAGARRGGRRSRAPRSRSTSRSRAPPGADRQRAVRGRAYGPGRLHRLTLSEHPCSAAFPPPASSPSSPPPAPSWPAARRSPSPRSAARAPSRPAKPLAAAVHDALSGAARSRASRRGSRSRTASSTRSSLVARRARPLLSGANGPPVGRGRRALPPRAAVRRGDAQITGDGRTVISVYDATTNDRLPDHAAAGRGRRGTQGATTGPVGRRRSTDVLDRGSPARPTCPAPGPPTSPGARLHRADLPQARRRPDRRGRAGLRRRQRHAAARRGLRLGRREARPRARGDRHLLRRGRRRRDLDASRRPRREGHRPRPARGRPGHPGHRRPGRTADVTGPARSPRALPFRLSAPDTARRSPPPRGAPRRGRAASRAHS